MHKQISRITSAALTLTFALILNLGLMPATNARSKADADTRALCASDPDFCLDDSSSAPPKARGRTPSSTSTSPASNWSGPDFNAYFIKNSRHPAFNMSVQRKAFQQAFKEPERKAIYDFGSNANPSTPEEKTTENKDAKGTGNQ